MSVKKTKNKTTKFATDSIVKIEKLTVNIPNRNVSRLYFFGKIYKILINTARTDGSPQERYTQSWPPALCTSTLII